MGMKWITQTPTVDTPVTAAPTMASTGMTQMPAIPDMGTTDYYDFAPIDAAPLMDLSASPLYQAYRDDLLAQQELAYGKNLDALKQMRATQGLLGSGPMIEDVTDLTNQSFRAKDPTAFMMPYLMGQAQGGYSAAQGLGQAGAGYAGDINQYLANFGSSYGGIMDALASATGSAYGAGQNYALMGGNLGAQGAMMPYNALMGGLGTYASLGGTFG